MTAFKLDKYKSEGKEGDEGGGGGIRSREMNVLNWRER